MKKAIALLLALVMVFALCACGGGDKSTADNGEKVVKIGVFEPASGDSGAGGKKEMLGMQYANQETPTVPAVCRRSCPTTTVWVSRTSP